MKEKKYFKRLLSWLIYIVIVVILSLGIITFMWAEDKK